MSSPWPPLPPELPHPAWPLIRVTDHDRQYEYRVALDTLVAANERRVGRQIRRATVHENLRKGAVLGLLFFGIIVGIGSQHQWLLADWHWLMALGVFVGMTLLAGFDIAFMVLASIGVVLAVVQTASTWQTINNWAWLGLCLSGGGIVRSIRTLFP